MVAQCWPCNQQVVSPDRFFPRLPTPLEPGWHFRIFGLEASRLTGPANKVSTSRAWLPETERSSQTPIPSQTLRLKDQHLLVLIQHLLHRVRTKGELVV